MSQLDNARRTLAKAEETLKACEQYFARQAEMNAQAHMAGRVMYPPIHGAISGVLHGIATFNECYPEGGEPDGS